MQQCSVSVNGRGIEIADAADKLARHMGIESFKASDGWLWRFRNRDRIGNKVERDESDSADISAVEHLGLKFNRLMKKENLSTMLTRPLCLGAHYQEIFRRSKMKTRSQERR